MTLCIVLEHTVYDTDIRAAVDEIAADMANEGYTREQVETAVLAWLAHALEHVTQGTAHYINQGTLGSYDAFRQALGEPANPPEEATHAS